MNYITAKDASKKWNINLRSVQRMCVAGQIDGAKKISNVWMIPEFANPVTKRKSKNLVGKDEILEAYFDFAFNRRQKFDAFFKKQYAFKDKLSKAYFYAVEAFRFYPQLDKMLPYFLKAKDLIMNTDLKLPELSLTMGGHFALAIFLYRSGIGNEVCQQLTEVLPVFEYLTGHKSGLDLLFKSALNYHRGMINEALHLAYKAIFTNDVDSDTKLGVSYVLAHISFLHGNLEGWNTVVEMLKTIIDENHTEEINAVIDIVDAELTLSAGMTTGIKEWLKTGDFDSKPLTINSAINAYLVHIRYLVRINELEKAIAILGVLIKNKHNKFPVPPHSKMYLYIIAAICYNRLSNEERAFGCLEKALEIAKQDKLYMFFAEYDNSFDGIIEKFFKSRDPEVYRKILQIKESYMDNYNSAKLYLQGSLMYDDLTQREKEIAILVAEGLQNSEIAKRLYISNSTVNYHVRNIYKKLGVNSRTLMINRLYFYLKND